ncbi:HAD family hydrolase [Candidatus Pacearchaeota archaeon]|nr:HAD family hydrolase [Candidatus Pacearchaeota archaeon]
MYKEIIATGIDGFLIKHEAFIEPHKTWFDRVIRLTGDKSLAQWKGRKDFFLGIDKAMKKIMPYTKEEQRLGKARKWYAEEIIAYLKEHPEAVYKDVENMLRKLKIRYALALITPSLQEYMPAILEAAGLSQVFDVIFVSKGNLPEEFTYKYREPIIYIAARNREIFAQAKELEIPCAYAAWDNFNREIADFVGNNAKSPDELKFLHQLETY